LRVVVTGTDGYIGCRLAPFLAARGHEVQGIDTGFYLDGWLYTDRAARSLPMKTVRKDLRLLDAADFAGADAVLHLAELSNDPLGENRPEITLGINHEGSVRIARLARMAGARRFVYASSCSVYGVGNGDFLDETSAVNPQTWYARCKVMVERDVGKMADDRFCVVFLRNATAFGPAPRMRFDIVLNDLCARAYTTGQIVLTSDGTPWRPLVHIDDICAAFACALEAPAGAVNAEIFNVGQTSENYRIRDLAEIVAAEFPGCEVSIGPAGGDNRSYRVSFDKIAQRLPGFAPRWTVPAGAAELHRLFARIELDAGTHAFRAYTRLKQLRYLARTGQIDEQLFWVSEPDAPAVGP
jgi:nucleoside-diphosphate-sugar epimerase